MRDQPFHHGNLRADLLDRAERTLREGGIEELSLRELARQAGVSHGAPRSHFADRQALLDALAERGFARMTDDLIAAIASEPRDFGRCLRAVARGYVRFAVTDAALLDLMFAAKVADPPEAVRTAAERLFSTFGALMDAGHASGLLRTEDLFRTKLLFAATMQGIASLIASRRISAEQGDELVLDSTATWIRSIDEADVETAHRFTAPTAP